jgi:D-lactate dehydrogenase (cytochrome)
MTASPSARFLDDIRAAVGPSGWTTDPATLAPFLAEERGNFRGACAIAVWPASTDEVAAVVRLCAKARVPITPQGGNTGLAGGAVPAGGVLLSLKKLKRIRVVDPLNFTMVAEAGCVLADAQRAAEEAGALFPLSLAAEGSCTIGGNLSTNAGGVHVLRYGTMRDLILGIEAVLPDGRVWDGLKGLRKDNTGYDLKHLFIGAEGTLGIVTAATLKLFPKLNARVVAFVALPTARAALDLFARLRNQAGEALCAFEFANRTPLEFVLRHIPETRDPFAQVHPWYVLAELASPRPDVEALLRTLESTLESAAQDGLAADAVLAQSEAQGAALWRLRESMSEAQKPEGGSIKHDVSVPLSRIPEFIERASALAEARIPGARVCAFGHMGDGNVHFNLSQPVGSDRERFLAEREGINVAVHDLVQELGGSFSAEHGIGRLRLKDMDRYKEDVELDLMRAVKAALDPAGIMNPGKVLPP